MAITVDKVIQESPDWFPPNMTISDVATSGAALFGNTAGYHISFDQSSDDAISFNLDLSSFGVMYDGSDIALEISWSLFSSAPGVGDAVKWDVTYAFVKADGTENGYTISDGNFEDTIVVDARTADTVYLDQLSTMTGKADATQLQVSMFRNSQGVGADTYGNAADLFKIRLKKV